MNANLIKIRENPKASLLHLAYRNFVMSGIFPMDVTSFTTSFSSMIDYSGCKG